MLFNDPTGKILDLTTVEVNEQLAIQSYVTSSAVVLELGASCGIISYKLNTIVGANHVAVEPDTNLQVALEANILANGLTIKTEKSAISKIPLISVPQLTLEALQTKYSLVFNTLVAFNQPLLEFIFQENPILYSQLDMVIFNRPSPSLGNFTTLTENLRKNGFGPVQTRYVEVWQKGYIPPVVTPDPIIPELSMFNPNLQRQ